MLRANYKDDMAAGDAERKRKREEKEADTIRKAQKRADKVNDAKEVDLCDTVERMNHEIAAAGDSKKAKVSFLKAQITGRISRGREYPLSIVGRRFRAKNGVKIKLGPDDKKAEVEYLTQLASKMITYDIGKYVNEDLALDVEVVRTLPTISTANTFAAATRLKEELSAEVREKVALQDDPVGQPLLEKYSGKLLRDKSDGQTFKVANVTAPPPPPLPLPSPYPESLCASPTLHVCFFKGRRR